MAGRWYPEPRPLTAFPLVSGRVDGRHVEQDQEQGAAARPRARPAAGSAARAGVATPRAWTDPGSAAALGGTPAGTVSGEQREDGRLDGLARRLTPAAGRDVVGQRREIVGDRRSVAETVDDARVDVGAPADRRRVAQHRRDTADDRSDLAVDCSRRVV